MCGFCGFRFYPALIAFFYLKSQKYSKLVHFNLFTYLYGNQPILIDQSHEKWLETFLVGDQQTTIWVS